MDALVFAFQLANSKTVDDEFDERQAFCDLAGGAELNLGALRFLLNRNRTADRFVFQNADIRCTYDRRARDGYTLEAVIRAAFLATHPLDESLRLAQRIAKAMGGAHAWRTQRVDLCADFVGFLLDYLDVDAFVTQRCHVVRFRSDAKDLDEVTTHPADIREHFDSRKRITGFSIAPGNCLMGRLYDKTAELRLSGREEKREIEEQLWRLAGWLIYQLVTRLEFQLRGPALKQFDICDPSTLRSKLDAVWQHCSREWLRLVDLRSASRLSRCRLDRRWEAVISTIFEHPAQPAKRQRVRGGASVENVFGTLNSRLAGSGKLPIGFGDAAQLVATMSPAQAEQWLRETFSKLYNVAAADAFETFVRKHGAQGAAIKIAGKIAAAGARFWSVDDLMDGLFEEPDANGSLRG